MRTHSPSPSHFIGPYLLGPQLAAGGMGVVRIGLKSGALGFQRLVAVKSLHPHLSSDPNFVARFKDEIRLVSHLIHPNIVQAFDVIEVADELALVMEFVDGVTFKELLQDARDAGSQLGMPIAVGIVGQALHGLHAAHEAIDDRGNGLLLVHCDVSPHNIMIGKAGLVKVLDFGVAKAATTAHITKTGQFSGKVSYMAPEQVTGRPVDRRTDVFAAGVVLWEALCGRRLFAGPGAAEATVLMNVVGMRIPPPSELRPEVSDTLDHIVLRALDRDPSRRFGSARDFALALEESVPSASASAVASAVSAISSSRVREREDALATFRVRVAPIVEPPAIALEATADARAQEEVTLTPLGPPEPPPTEARELELETTDVQGTLVGSHRPERAPEGRGWWSLLALPVLIAGGLAWRVSKPSMPEGGVPVVRQNSTSSGAAVLAAKASPAQETKPMSIAAVDLAALPSAQPPTKPRKTPKDPRSPRARESAATPPCSPPMYVDTE